MSGLAAATAASRRSRFGRVVAGVAVLGLTAGASVALAADPRPDRPQGATVSIAVPDVPVGGQVGFTGTGFTGAQAPGGPGPGGELVCVKIDDGNVVDLTKSDTFAQVTSAPDGTIQGTIDLAKVHPDTPVAPGAHWIRLLTGTCKSGDLPRSLHAKFTVQAPVAAPPVVPTDPGAPAPTPTPVTTPVAPPPTRVTDGPVQVTLTALELQKKSRLVLSLKAGAKGSAGTVRIRTKNKYKLGKGPKKVRTLFKSDAYFVEPVSTIKVRLTLTPEGKALFRKKKSLKAVVELRDASEVTVTQPVVIKR